MNCNIRVLLLLCLLTGLSPLLTGQSVDSIKVEQSGDYLKIGYRILNSNINQVYRVTILCSIDGGLNRELRSITGDVGPGVSGGKPEYWAVWDVLKDVDELTSVEFIVRAELIRDVSVDKLDQRAVTGGKFYLLLTAESDGPKFIFGVRVAYMGAWGVTGRFNAGSKNFSSVSLFEREYPAYSAGLGLTKRVVNGDKFQMHIFAGYAILKLEQAYPDQMETKVFNTYEGGFIMGIGRIGLSLSMATVNGDLVDGGNLFPSFGIGARF